MTKKKRKEKSAANRIYARQENTTHRCSTLPYAKSRASEPTNRVLRIRDKDGRDRQRAHASKQVSANGTIGKKHTIVQSLGESKGSRLRVSPVIYRGLERPINQASEPTNAKEPDLDQRPVRLVRTRPTIIFGQETSIAYCAQRACACDHFTCRLLVLCSDLERVDLTGSHAPSGLGAWI